MYLTPLMILQIVGILFGAIAIGMSVSNLIRLNRIERDRKESARRR